MSRAADDTVAIRSRMDELARDREAAAKEIAARAAAEQAGEPVKDAADGVSPSQMSGFEWIAPGGWRAVCT